MEFGVFYQLPCADDQSPADRYADTIAQAQLADELGFDAVWLAELHFNPRFSIMSAPLLVAAAIAQTTRRIKVGTAVNLVPLHHPIRLAEETATLDVISGGRCIFGIGRGSNPRQFEGYGVDVAGGRQRFTEAVDFILKAWTNEEFSYRGEHYQAENLRIMPKPQQKPHPPVYIASNSPDTFELVGSMGHNILVAPLVVSMQGAVDGLAVYRETLLEHGHDPAEAKINVNVPVYVTEDRNKARAALEPSFENYLGLVRASRSSATRRLHNLTYGQICDELGAIGDPDQCVAKLRAFQETYQPQEFMCWFNPGGLLPHQEVEKSMRLFAQEVMPQFQEAAASPIVDQVSASAEG
ncbi:MAG: LLM class flavin-dependent oxidoreductase [Chloroflexi bacterium]|nr:LLM class flavin-dependent oxidoreductase [Chloroflexota bacterium]